MIVRSLLFAALFVAPALPEAVAGDTAETEAIVEAVFDTGPVKSFMLQRDGEMLIDAHRMGMRAGRATNVKSVAKSILSLLVGIAIEQGHLQAHRLEPVGDGEPAEAAPDDHGGL